MSHSIIKCKTCLEIVMQCRCMDHHNVNWIEKCDKCKSKTELFGHNPINDFNAPTYGPQAHNSFKNMTQKSYADECLERAEKATNPPWTGAAVKLVLTSADPTRTHGPDAEFIAHARQDVPELARRLKKACEELRTQASVRAEKFGEYLSGERLNDLVDKLEDMPEEK